MEKIEITRILTALNRDSDPSVIVIYADLFTDYRAAQKNIDENGCIVFHPKTGAPIVNPFLAVRDSTLGRLLKLDLETGDLWK